MPTTINYSRGEVVLLPFPFSDQSTTKLRPAVVVNPDYPSEDLIVVALSSVAGELRPGEFPIKFWREAGLLHPTFVKRAIATVSTNLVHKSLGNFQNGVLTQLGVALRYWLKL